MSQRGREHRAVIRMQIAAVRDEERRRAEQFDLGPDGVRQLVGRDEVELGRREIQKVDSRNAQDRVGGIQFPAQGFHLFLGVQFRHAAGDHQHVHPVAVRGMAGDDPAAAENFVIRMSGHNK